MAKDSHMNLSAQSGHPWRPSFACPYHEGLDRKQPKGHLGLGTKNVGTSSTGIFLSTSIIVLCQWMMGFFACIVWLWLTVINLGCGVM